MGKGVTKAVENVNTIIAPALLGKDPTDQKMIDDLMIQLDGTKHPLVGVHIGFNSWIPTRVKNLTCNNFSYRSGRLLLQVLGLLFEWTPCHHRSSEI